jgi:hypothetical protein
MPEYFEPESEPRVGQRYIGGWRVVASAWALAIMVVLAFGGVQALASRHALQPTQERLVGAVIPRHDPSCGGPGDLTAASPNCRVTAGVLDQAEAEAEINAADSGY